MSEIATVEARGSDVEIESQYAAGALPLSLAEAHKSIASEARLARLLSGTRINDLAWLALSPEKLDRFISEWIRA